MWCNGDCLVRLCVAKKTDARSAFSATDSAGKRIGSAIALFTKLMATPSLLSQRGGAVAFKLLRASMAEEAPCFSVLSKVLKLRVVDAMALQGGFENVFVPLARSFGGSCPI